MSNHGVKTNKTDEVHAEETPSNILSHQHPQQGLDQNLEMWNQIKRDLVKRLIQEA